MFCAAQVVHVFLWRAILHYRVRATRIAALVLTGVLAGCSFFQRTNPNGWTPQEEPTCSDSRAASIADAVVGLIGAGGFTVFLVKGCSAGCEKLLVLPAVGLVGLLGAVRGEGKVRVCREAKRRRKEWISSSSSQSAPSPPELETSDSRRGPRVGRGKYWVGLFAGPALWETKWDNYTTSGGPSTAWVGLELGYRWSRELALVADSAFMGDFGESLFGQQTWLTLRPHWERGGGFPVWTGMGPSLVLADYGARRRSIGFGGELMIGGAMLSIPGLSSYVLLRAGRAWIPNQPTGYMGAVQDAWTWHVGLAIGIVGGPEPTPDRQ